MTKYAMAIDLDRCVGCHACVIACKAEWELEEEKSRCWVKPIGPEEINGEIGLTFYTGLCNHCDQPSCIDECPTGATYKDSYGRVLVDKELCIGCGNCVIACPYGARYTSSIDNKVEKCTFCDQRVNIGLLPACVETCPTEARVFGDIENRGSDVYKKVFEEESYPLATRAINLNPNVYYSGKNRDFSLLIKHYAPEKINRSNTNMAWKNLSPMIIGSFGLTSLGVIGAFLAQLFFGEEDNHE
ncbi:MAG: 4Fe-4S dicluster domain-containing protein [Proteobacteria bacterium]|nr:4Fe-4S dicluster domain-containing protein [Pseudomonadota bacterium]